LVGWHNMTAPDQQHLEDRSGLLSMPFIRAEQMTLSEHLE
jgi:hypothetical protein